MKLLKNILGLNLYISIRERYRKIKALIKKFLGKKSIEDDFYRVQKKYLGPINKKLPFGVNIIGYINSESGIGEISRGMIRAIQKTNIPYSVYNFDIGWHRTADNSIANFSDELPYSINLFCFNAEETSYRLHELGEKKLRGKYKIALWAWELENFPSKWNYGFDYVDEIWTISEFSKKSISKATNLLIKKIPLLVDFKINNKFDRKYFDIDKKAFVFMFSFDGFSFADRKNPFATAKAYASKFKNIKDALLIIKFHNVDWFHKIKLLQILKGTNYKIIDKYLDRDEFLGLLNSIDCYVSLHRSEGFGYGLAEAMYLGKQVIATNYSGNLDFMNEENSNLVKYKLVEIKKNAGPYEKGNKWAEADIEDASEKMLEVYKKINIEKIKKGQKTIQEMFSVEAVAKEVLLVIPSRKLSGRNP